MKLINNYENLYNKLNNPKPLFLSSNTNQVLLRHDVDHSIDSALLLSNYERERKISSTYFILHTANYFNDEKTLKKIKKKEDNGHEIGLHTNFLEEWFLKNYDIKKNLEKVLDYFHRNKIKIRGISSHGSKFCYSEKFINSWVFKECKYTNEIRNGEDILETDSKYQICLPKNKYLKNQFNNRFKMWSIKLADYSLYYAHNLNYRNYITDSGNSFKRSKDLKNFKSVQLNLHPEHVLSNIKFNGYNFDINYLEFFNKKNLFSKILGFKNLTTNRFVDKFYTQKNKIIIQLRFNKIKKCKINLFRRKHLLNYDLISSNTVIGDNFIILSSLGAKTSHCKLDITIYENSNIKSLDIFEF